jgi:membrane protein required for colicin V production
MYNLFDLITLIVVGFFGFAGLRRGLIEEAFKLIGIILASYIAVRFYGVGVLLIEQIFAISEGIKTVIGFIIVFLAVYLTIQLIASVLKRIIRSLKLAWLDRITGLGFGALKAILIMALIVWCFSIFSDSGFVRKLEASSPAYIYLHKCERLLVRGFGIQTQAKELEEKIRSIFRLDREIPISIPFSPDSLTKKIEYIDIPDSIKDSVW